jgi:hypothetical protein
MIRPDALTDRMVPSGAVTHRQAVHQPRPFDTNEPSTRAPVPTPEEEAEAEQTTLDGEPGEHAEIPHPEDAVVEGEDDDDA